MEASTFLRYSPEFDSTVISAVEHDLHTKVHAAEKLDSGEFNYSYKIATDNNPLIARIFRERNSPVDGKLEWIENQLSSHHITHAKMVFYTRENNYFPFGYMVSDFLSGKDGKKAIFEGDISFEEFFNKLAVLLHQIHEIPTVGFGEVRNGRGEYDTYYDSKVGLYESLHEKLKPLSDIETTTHERVFREVQKLIEFESMFSSVLLHGDPPPGNSILRPNGNLVLIDWDNTKCGSWIDEYTGLSTRGAFMWQHELTEEARNDIIKRSFKNHYSGINFNDPKLLEVMKILEIMNAYTGIAVHYYQHEDMELYETAKKRLNKLLTS
jgi:hypothetical protein